MSCHVIIFNHQVNVHATQRDRTFLSLVCLESVSGNPVRKVDDNSWPFLSSLTTALRTNRDEKDSNLSPGKCQIIRSVVLNITLYVYECMYTAKKWHQVKMWTIKSINWETLVSYGHRSAINSHWMSSRRTWLVSELETSRIPGWRVGRSEKIPHRLSLSIKLNRKCPEPDRTNPFAHVYMEHMLCAVRCRNMKREYDNRVTVSCSLYLSSSLLWHLYGICPQL